MELTGDAGSRGDATTPDICILLNPGSGKKDVGAGPAIREAIARHPGRFELQKLKKGMNPVKAARSAAEAGYTTLVAAGGDGTVGAVASVAREKGLTLGVVPLGTFNYFARGLDLPEDIDAAIDLIARGPTRTASPGEVNGALFLNNASLGLYPAILAQREGTYRRWGRSRLAAHWSVLVTFMRYKPRLGLSLAIDGKDMQRNTPLAFVARSAHQLELFGIEGADAVRDGRFALFIAPDADRWRLIWIAARLFWRSSRVGHDFEVLTGSEIDIDTRRGSRLIARDGERERMKPPFRFRVLRDELRVIAPEPDGQPDGPA